MRPKFVCSQCENVVEAPALSWPITRWLVAPGLLTHALISTYADHCLLYPQSETYARQGVENSATLPGAVGYSLPVALTLVPSSLNASDALYNTTAPVSYCCSVAIGYSSRLHSLGPRLRVLSQMSC